MKKEEVGRIGKKVQFHISKICRTLKRRDGMTLVELIVTSAILMIFSVGTCRVMADSMQIFYKMRGLNNAQQVMDMLMDKITGELEGAQVSMLGKTEQSEAQGAETPVSLPTLIISADHSSVKCYDSTLSKIEIKADESGLVIHYDPVESKNTENVPVQVYEAVDWRFDKAAYMGYEIEELKFSQADPTYPKHIIKVEMEIKGVAYGTLDSLKSTRYVECYNFADDGTNNYSVQIKQETQSDAGE